MDSNGAVAINICVRHENTVGCPLTIRCVVATSGQGGAASLRILLIQPSAEAGVEHPLTTLASPSVFTTGSNYILLRVVGGVEDWHLLGHCRMGFSLVTSYALHTARVEA